MAQSFSPSGVFVKGLSLEHLYCLLVRRFLSGYSGVLQFAAANDFDNVEAAPFLHELKIGNQPLLARGQEDEGGVYNSNAKFGTAIYLAPVLHAVIKVVAHEPKAQTSRSLTRFLWHEATESIATPPSVGN